MTPRAITVCVVDDYDVIVQGTATLLAPHGDLVRVVGPSNHEGPDHRVDIALLDCFALPDNGAAIIGALTANPRVGRVAIFAWSRDRTLIDAAFASGADAYLSKALPGRELAEALAASMHEDRLVRIGGDDTDSGGDPGDAPTRDWPGQAAGLSERESEVLALITQGEPTKAIAATLYVGINTVKTHVRHIYGKIGVTSRSAAVLWGIDHGFRPDRNSSDDWRD